MINQIKRAFAQLRRREEGVTSLEYALIGGIIIVAIAGSVRILGQSTDGAFKRYADAAIAAMP